MMLDATATLPLLSNDATRRTRDARPVSQRIYKKASLGWLWPVPEYMAMEPLFEINQGGPQDFLVSTPPVPQRVDASTRPSGSPSSSRDGVCRVHEATASLATRVVGEEKAVDGLRGLEAEQRLDLALRPWRVFQGLAAWSRSGERAKERLRVRRGPGPR